MYLRVLSSYIFQSQQKALIIFYQITLAIINNCNN